MNFKVAPDAFQKLSLLDSALDFEPAGNQPLQESAGPLGMRQAALEFGFLAKGVEKGMNLV